MRLLSLITVSATALFWGCITDPSDHDNMGGDGNAAMMERSGNPAGGSMDMMGGGMMGMMGDSSDSMQSCPMKAMMPGMTGMESKPPTNTSDHSAHHGG